MNLNWFCRSNEIQQWFRFENLQTPQESLGPTQDAKLTELHFIGYYPPLVQFFFLKIFQRTTVVGFGSRSWVLYLPPTQKNLFAYGIYAAFVWHMFARLTPRMGSLRQWVGGVTAGQSLLLLSGKEELWSSKWFHFCFSEEKDKQGQSIKRKRQWWVGGLYVYMSVCAYIYIYIHTHTPILWLRGQSQEPKIAPTPKC